MAIAIAGAMAVFLSFFSLVPTLEGTDGGSKIFSSHLLLGSRATSVLFVDASPVPSIMPGTQFPIELLD